MCMQYNNLRVISKRVYECIHIIPETEKKFTFTTAVLLLRIMMKLTNRFHVAMRMRSNK